MKYFKNKKNTMSFIVSLIIIAVFVIFLLIEQIVWAERTDTLEHTVDTYFQNIEMLNNNKKPFSVRTNVPLPSENDIKTYNLPSSFENVKVNISKKYKIPLKRYYTVEVQYDYYVKGQGAVDYIEGDGTISGNDTGEVFITSKSTLLMKYEFGEWIIDRISGLDINIHAPETEEEE